MIKFTIFPLLLATLFLQGCGDSKAADSKTLTQFLSLHAEYCAADFSSAEQLISELHKDATFVASENYDGIYEKKIGELSYAVSPEESGCTTDLKLRTSAKGKPYFGFEEMNTALLSKGYKLKGVKEIRTELGLDNQELKVVEQKYVSNDNNISTLVFPLENEDQYYMTLFVEKFEIQGASLAVSPPALVEI